MPPIARGQTWLCQPLPVSTVPNTGRNLSNSNCRGLDEEEEWLIVQGYGNVTSMQFTGSYYRCYTVLRAPAILKGAFHGTCFFTALLFYVRKMKKNEKVHACFIVRKYAFSVDIIEVIVAPPYGISVLKVAPPRVHRHSYNSGNFR